MIKLHSAVGVDLMFEVTKVLQLHSDRELSYFTVNQGADSCELLAKYNGNGLFPSVFAVIQTYPAKYLSNCQHFAEDLNAIFNLTDPDFLGKQQNEWEKRDELVHKYTEIVAMETETLIDESDAFRELALTFSGFLSLEQTQSAFEEFSAYMHGNYEIDLASVVERNLNEVISRRG